MWVEHLYIPDDEIKMTAVRAQGAGGQNVNKVSTAIHLKFTIMGASLPLRVKQNLLNCGDTRINKAGEIIIKAQQSRSQLINKEQAKRRLKKMIAQALITKKVRIKTKPSKASKQRRLNNKNHRSGLKKTRSKIEQY